MKNLLLSLGVITIFVAAFSMGHKAEAMTLVNQTAMDGYILNCGTTGPSNTPCWNGLESNKIATSSPAFAGFVAGHGLSAATTSYISSVTVMVARNHSDIQSLSFNCSSTGGSGATSLNSLNTDTLSDVSFSPFTFYFAVPNGCELHTQPVEFFTISTPRDDIKWGGTDVPNGAYPYFGVGDNTEVVNTNYQPYMVINDQNGSSSSYSIGFNPPLVDNFSSPDFKNWWLTESIPPDHSGTSGYYFAVFYGTSTPYGVGYDSLKDIIGIIPLSGGQGVSDSPILTKSATTTAGTYEAQAVLYDQNNATLTQSSILHFTITGNGSVILDYPQGAQTASVTTCGTTNFTFVGVDVGYNLCTLGRFLLVPSQAQLNQFTNTQALLGNTPPFSYLYQLTNAIGSTTAADASISPLTLNIGATGTPIHFSQDMFSAATIDRYTSPTVRGTLRTLIQWALYLSFVAMIILEVRHMFKTTPKQ